MLRDIEKEVHSSRLWNRLLRKGGKEGGKVGGIYTQRNTQMYGDDPPQPA